MTCNKINTDILDNLIIGRVEPYIYAFSTETIPNYLKVGDTYRSIQVRLNEWRKFFPDLKQLYAHTAKLSDGTFFRDFAVHYVLEFEKGHSRLLPNAFEGIPYYSREFFEGAKVADIEDAIIDINRSFSEKDGKYHFYTQHHLPAVYTYERTESYNPRPNQQITIERFKKALEKGRTNLLMYAVMRFGKSFTAMCCAIEMSAKFVIIVSAKADVKNEWKKTVESHIRFEGFKFFDSDILMNNENIISNSLAENIKIALFLTLQDLQGTDIKVKHREIFENNIDLLIIDETHFGARAAEYGKILKKQNISNDLIKKELKDSDFSDGFEETLKVLDSRIKLHLSGTPYRILMGDEFTKEDIISFCQFTDIVEEQRKWDNEHLLQDDTKEWDNPYYGFPQMIRFAFNPNQSSIQKLAEMRAKGFTDAFSELFKPKSIGKDREDRHKEFIHEQEVLDLLEVIDGSKDDENVLGFLNYDKIKDGKMCRHIVCVLPFRASCDAFETLIKNNITHFKNLSDYEIINIAGVSDERKYPTTQSIVSAIKYYESKRKKTITLTVNRMLTGSTVEEWDTMLYLKDTASPQEYDQAIFRLQNQYIRVYKNEEGDTIRYNMKPQTLLVDFDPNRLFHMQELKSQFYNANIEQNGNTKLEERIRKELQISPIIILNHNKLSEVTSTNILDAIRKYSQNKSILDEAIEIPVDYSLFADENIRAEIDKLSPIDAKKGLDIKPVDGDEVEYDIPDISETTQLTDALNQPKTDTKESETNTYDNSLEKKLATYYSKILFFAFLTKSKVKSLGCIIEQILVNEENQRIAKNIGLRLSILKLIQNKSNTFILSKLDYKVHNINSLVHDTQLSPTERAEIAMKKFGRLSESEIVTPIKVATEMVYALPEEELNTINDVKILDIASKQGEFTCALLKKFGDVVKSNIYAIPTSPLTYEFTLKVYELLGMPIENVFTNFNSYDIINSDNKKIIELLKDMKFNVIIGNPPYQISDGGNGSSASPIYNQFVDVAKSISPDFIVIIMPAKWYSGGKGLNQFRIDMLNDTRITKIVDYSNSLDCFPSVDVAGGVCYFLWDKKHNGVCEFINNSNGKVASISKRLNEHKFLIRYPKADSILKKILNVGELNMSSMVSSRKPFGLATNIKPLDSGDIILRYNKGFGPYKSAHINVGIDLIDKWNVMLSYLTAEHAGQPDKNGQYRILSTLEILPPKTICTETYLLAGSFEDNLEAANLMSYLKTRFVRFLISLVAVSQHITKDCFTFVPIQDFSRSWSDKELYEKYGLTNDEITFIETHIKSMV